VPRTRDHAAASGDLLLGLVLQRSVGRVEVTDAPAAIEAFVARNGHTNLEVRAECLDEISVIDSNRQQAGRHTRRPRDKADLARPFS
jgi:hypothetical protein